MDLREPGWSSEVDWLDGAYEQVSLLNINNLKIPILAISDNRIWLDRDRTLTTRNRSTLKKPKSSGSNRLRWNLVSVTLWLRRLVPIDLRFPILLNRTFRYEFEPEENANFSNLVRDSMDLRESGCRSEVDWLDGAYEQVSLLLINDLRIPILAVLTHFRYSDMRGPRSDFDDGKSVYLEKTEIFKKQPIAMKLGQRNLMVEKHRSYQS